MVGLGPRASSENSQIVASEKPKYGLSEAETRIVASERPLNHVLSEMSFRRPPRGDLLSETSISESLIDKNEQKFREAQACCSPCDLCSATSAHLGTLVLASTLVG